MTNREKFILIFINQFFNKSQRKRRSSKNKAPYIAHTINNVCKSYFNRRLKFSNKEIYKAFSKNKYTLMESGNKDFTWDRYLNGHYLISCDLFINIDPQCNHDLKLVMKRTYPPNFKPETVERIDNLKRQLNTFWLENKEKLHET